MFDFTTEQSYYVNECSWGIMAWIFLEEEEKSKAFNCYKRRYESRMAKREYSFAR